MIKVVTGHNIADFEHNVNKHLKKGCTPIYESFQTHPKGFVMFMICPEQYELTNMGKKLAEALKNPEIGEILDTPEEIVNAEEVPEC
jgi:hypothetical protein